MASPATVLMPVRRGQGWVHIVPSAWHQLWSHRDLQGKSHPRKASGNGRAKRKNRIRQRLSLCRCSHCLSPTARGQEGPFPRARRGHRDHRAGPKAALGPGKPRESKSVPTEHRPSPRHHAAPRMGWPQPRPPARPKPCTPFAGAGKAPAQGRVPAALTAV